MVRPCQHKTSAILKEVWQQCNENLRPRCNRSAAAAYLSKPTNPWGFNAHNFPPCRNLHSRSEPSFTCLHTKELAIQMLHELHHQGDCIPKQLTRQLLHNAVLHQSPCLNHPICTSLCIYQWARLCVPSSHSIYVCVHSPTRISNWTQDYCSILKLHGTLDGVSYGSYF